MKAHYVTNNPERKIAVILLLKSCKKMMAELDKLEAIKVFDKIKAGKSYFIATEDMFKAIERKRKL